MNTQIASLVAVVIVLVGAGCSASSAGREESAGTNETTLASAGVLVLEPGSRLRDYEIGASKLRLFGVQTGDETFATIADRSTWKTTNVHVGEAIGRGYRVAAIGAASLDLESVKGTTRIAAGDDFEIRMIRHRFDAAATDHGKHAWTVQAATMAEIRARYGHGGAAEDRAAIPPTETGLGRQSAVVLTRVDPNGVLGRIGLHADDVLLSMDGAPLIAADLDALSERLTRTGKVTLVVSEHGARHPLTIDVQ